MELSKHKTELRSARAVHMVLLVPTVKQSQKSAMWRYTDHSRLLFMMKHKH